MTEWFTFTWVLSGSDWSGDIGILSVNYSGVETIEASKIVLYCCLSSHLPADLFNFLMFFRHICSYRALLLNDCYNPNCSLFFSRWDWIKPLMMIYFCSNDSISNIVTITLFNALGLSYCYARTVFPSIWKIHSFPCEGIFDKFGAVVVVLQSSNEVKLQLFFRVVSNGYESSLSLTLVLTQFLLLWYNIEDAKACETTSELQSLVRRSCIEEPGHCGIKK